MRTTTTTYYRVFDHQRGDYFATGYNATSKEELISDFQSYLAIDVKDSENEIKTWEQIADSLQDISLEESNEPFEEIDL